MTYNQQHFPVPARTLMTTDICHSVATPACFALTYLNIQGTKPPIMVVLDPLRWLYLLRGGRVHAETHRLSRIAGAKRAPRL